MLSFNNVHDILTILKTKKGFMQIVNPLKYFMVLVANVNGFKIVKIYFCIWLNTFFVKDFLNTFFGKPEYTRSNSDQSFPINNFFKWPFLRLEYVKRKHSSFFIMRF